MCDRRQSETNSTAVLDQVEKRRKTWPMRKEVFFTRERWLYLNSIGSDPSVRSKLHQEDRFQLNKTSPLIIRFVPRLVTVFRYWQNYFRPRNSGWITLTCPLPSIVVSMRDKRRRLHDRGNDNSRSQQFVRKKFLSFISRKSF